MMNTGLQKRAERQIRLSWRLTASTCGLAVFGLTMIVVTAHVSHGVVQVIELLTQGAAVFVSGYCLAVQVRVREFWRSLL